MAGTQGSMFSKTVVPAPLELTDYGGDRKVPITKELDKCHDRVCTGCKGNLHILENVTSKLRSE